MGIRVSPSILAANFADLKSALQQVCSADYLHLDVMDGHFVPNISIGVPVVAAIRKATNQILDVHLMISNPAQYIEAFVDAGADILTVHYEALNHPVALEQLIRTVTACGKKIAIAIKPTTPATVLFPYIIVLDMVLVMTVEPGFGGQVFLPDMLEKIRLLKQHALHCNTTLDIQVDGGINRTTAPLAVKAGANILVAGHSVFGAENPASEIAWLQQSGTVYA